MSDTFTHFETEAFTPAGFEMEFEDEAMDLLDEVGFEQEGDEFFKKIFRGIKKGVTKVAPILKRLAPIAARVVGGAVGGPFGAMAAGALSRALTEDEAYLEDEGGFSELYESEWEDFGEFEGFEGLGEDEGEAEDEDEGEPIGMSAESESLAEAFAAEAAVAESESEAAGLVGGVTIQIFGPTPLRVQRMAPVVLRSGVRLTRLLRRSRRTRPLVPIVASIQKQTARALVRRSAKGGKITPKTARRVMAIKTAKTLASPNRVAKALAKNAIKRRRVGRRTIAGVER